MTEPAAALAWILGQRSETPIAISGWLGEHPEDGRDVAHLIVHPLAVGVADKMRQLAQLLGLAQASTGRSDDVQTPAGPPSLTPSTAKRSGCTTARPPQIHRPIDTEWKQVLRAAATPPSGSG